MSSTSSTETPSLRAATDDARASRLAFADPGRFELYFHSSPFTIYPEASPTMMEVYIPLETATYDVTRQAETGRTVTHRLGSRDILVIRAGHSHTIEWRRSSGILSLKLFEGFVERCVDAAQVRMRNAFTMRDAFVTTAATQLRAAIQIDRTLNPAFTDAIATLIACRVTAAAVVDRTIRADPGVTALSSRQLATLERYVDEHLNRIVTLPDLARLVHISPWHFMRRFHASHGMSPRQYVIHRRLAKAKALLRASEMTITDTALEVGMTHSHFSRTFRLRYGVSPREFRERDRQRVDWGSDPSRVHVLQV